MTTVSTDNKPHIGIYGRCNSGKSTLLNFITGGDYSIVSGVAGTTADPVRKFYEITGFAPVVFIDTAGIDDSSQLGPERRRKSIETLSLIDAAVLVYNEWGAPEEDISAMLRDRAIPFISFHNMHSGNESFTVHNKGDAGMQANLVSSGEPERSLLLSLIKKTVPESSYKLPPLFEGKASSGDIVLLVCPIDGGAPAGRIILPQVQAIRALLDIGAVAVVTQPEQLVGLLAGGLKPVLIVTDSQVFGEVAPLVPGGVELTSFSMLLARMKGDWDLYTDGLSAIEGLKDGDRLLILENCLHHSSCDDIGRVKIPALLSGYTGKRLSFDVVSGLSPLPADLGSYALAIQCGGCTVTRSQLRNRIRTLNAAGVAVTNYGMCLKKLTLK